MAKACFPPTYTELSKLGNENTEVSVLFTDGCSIESLRIFPKVVKNFLRGGKCNEHTSSI